MPLISIARQLTIYGGIILFIVGVFGNGMNIFIFSTVRTYRTTPCTFYFLISSLCDLLYISINLIPRILTTSYGVDPSRYSTAWCKLQHFLIGLLSLTSFTCACLTTIDQFLVTSRNAALRRRSQIKWSHRIVLIVFIVWFLHAIPELIYYDIIPGKSCNTTNATFDAYISFYLLGLLCIIPITIMVIFGSLAYRNIRKTTALAEQHADRQLMKMVSVQVGMIIFSMGPFGVFVIYDSLTAGTNKSYNQQVNEYFAGTVILLLTYVYYVGTFYMFLISSSRFCRTVKERTFSWRQFNRIQPSQT